MLNEFLFNLLKEAKDKRLFQRGDDGNDDKDHFHRKCKGLQLLGKKGFLELGESMNDINDPERRCLSIIVSSLTFEGLELLDKFKEYSDYKRAQVIKRVIAWVVGLVTSAAVVVAVVKSYFNLD